MNESSITAEQFRDTAVAIEREVGKVIVGQRDLIRHTLITLLAGGNALLEGVPGLGKTMLVRTLAQAIDCTFSRIQFTPDLMPADIVGTNIVVEDERGHRQFRFEAGPVFANLLLADEINRATPKTQSALLEAMQEHSVTVSKTTYRLQEPFFVLATQNPLEMEGSLPLEETVLAGGQLLTGEELLKTARGQGVALQVGETELYELPGLWTYSLDAEGKFRHIPCWVYALPYQGKLIQVRTRTGREIRVTADHPFLVNERGGFRWKKATELKVGDFLVCPARLPEGPNLSELMSHEEALDILSYDYKIVPYEELEAISRRSGHWQKMNELSFEDFDRLRIASMLKKKQLAAELGLDTRGYWRLVSFLRGRSQNAHIREALERYFAIHPPELTEVCDYIESFSITRLKPFEADPEVAAWLGFLLAEGAISPTAIAVYQKNYPLALRAFIRTTQAKMGIQINAIRDQNGTQAVVIRSKPLIEYLRLRFGIKPGQGVPSWFVAWPQPLRQAFLKTFIGLESHLDVKARRITFSQKDRGSVNTTTYLLLKEGLLPWLKDRKRIYRILLQGEDYDQFLQVVGWIDPAQAASAQLKGPHYSSHRVIPISGEQLRTLRELLKPEHLWKRTWYNAYKYACQRDLISVHMLRLLVNDLQGELERSVQAHSSLADCHEIEEATALLQYFAALASDRVAYDRIEKLESQDYQGQVFGLTVPGEQNYLAGLGACGINHNTYPLPEAQLDRFFFKVDVPFPSADELVEIANRTTGAQEPQPDSVADGAMIVHMQELARGVPIASHVTEYAARLLKATHPDDPAAPEIVRRYVRYGASPRGMQAMILAGKIIALLDGRYNVAFDDLRAAALPALRHRLILSFEGQAEGVTTDAVVEAILEEVVPEE